MCAKRLRIVGVALVLAVVMPLAGCGAIAEKAAETAVEKSTGVEIDQEGEEVTVKGDDGTEVTASADGELPDGFPEDVPVYDGTIVSTMKAEDMFTVGIETEDDMRTVLDWYIDKCDSDGWTKTTEMTVQDGGMVAAEKDDRVLQVTVGQSSDEGVQTVITLMTTPK